MFNDELHLIYFYVVINIIYSVNIFFYIYTIKKYTCLVYLYILLYIVLFIIHF